ncbi:hypothetical protein [uncultured Rikenella sp.]|uniref:hypothetical protein n=1 Tax=uncultured Rikenella sp. TaxID=368003 RepID=UPI0025EFAF95|nr:hypothetical protein [uncultured Rikenella sp.]
MPLGTQTGQPLSYTSVPAPGYRHRDTSALDGVGSNGYSWSSTVCGTDGMHVGFGMTWLNPSSAHNRVYGFQLRCLSE